MCGIIGYIGPKQVTTLLVEGLRRLEYRGYDSAGIAVVEGDEIALRREVAGRHVGFNEGAQNPEGDDSGDD